MPITQQSSYRSPSGVAASVQKRRTLYLAESDPRVKSRDTITRYQNDYYAEIVVLTDDEYLKLLSSQIGTQVDSAIYAEPLAVGTVLHPPTNLYWDYKNDPKATEFVPINGGNEVNITITFDPGDNDLAGLTYTPIINGANNGITGTSLGAASNLAIDSTTFHIQTYTPNEITITWRGYTDAYAYNVNVVGANLPAVYYGQNIPFPFLGVGFKARDYNLDYGTFASSLKLDSNGRAKLTLYPATSVFSGLYTVKISPQYTKGPGKPDRVITFNVDNHSIPITIDGANYANN